MQLQDHEKKHIDFLRQNAHECTLFLKRDNAFPIDGPCTVALYGNGARKTVKGGTGSGDVASRFFVNFEQGLKESGFTVTTGDWLDSYDEINRAAYTAYVKEAKKAAKAAGYMPVVFSMGYFPAEPEYDLPLKCDADIALYVLSRNSGEGNDRRLIPGDVYLSKTEIRDIMWLNEHYDRFMLVLNVGGVVDLSPVMAVKNILCISQLGVVTGNVLPDIILGRSNPSGKLTTTWATPEAYPTYENFGTLQDVDYKEGIYVGYRYFDSAGKKPLFPFGFGLSYSEFEISYRSCAAEGTVITVKAEIKNISALPGKEVAQLYVSEPDGALDKAEKQLAAFKKTKLLAAGQTEEIELCFDFKDIAAFSEQKACYMLEKGDYIIRLGNSSENTKAVACIRLNADAVVKQCENKMGRPGFTDMVIPRKARKDSDAADVGTAGTGADRLDHIDIDAAKIPCEKTVYAKDVYIDHDLDQLSDHELMLLTLGHHEPGLAAIVGDSCKHVPGGAGETCLSVPSVNKSVTMADGPAGLRLKAVYGVDKKGTYDLSVDPMMEKMLDFLPKAAGLLVKPSRKRHGEVHYQYTTAIPIGTAIAQSFNNDFAEGLGNLVAEEMELFGVDLWLAPALNIHRNICCGRNFEYFSEDPFVSGKIAAAVSKGVEAHKGRGVTIKHFLCNNQELNRNNGNSRVSERALREIYLRGFEICIKEAAPKALMTSYNLVNNVHTSESYELINDILRCELHYKGLVMSDWIASGRTFCKKAEYPAPYASNNIKAGNDLTMPGAKADERDIMKALRTGKLKREDLICSASRVVRSIKGI